LHSNIRLNSAAQSQYRLFVLSGSNRLIFSFSHFQTTADYTIKNPATDFPDYLSTVQSYPSTDNATEMTYGIPTEQLVYGATVIIIGIVGTLANGTVLYVLGVSKQLKKHAVNILFINQLALDLFGCFWLAVTHPIEMVSIYLEGSPGYWFCIIILSEDFIWTGINGSKLNLMTIAIERYVKIVCPIWHKNHFRQWMIYLAVAIPWSFSICTIKLGTFLTTDVVDGQCWWGKNWVSPAAKDAYAAVYFTVFFALIFFTLLFCYSSILYVVRRRAKVNTNPLVSVSNSIDARIQMNAVKTMIVISVAFVVCWLPCDLYIAMTLIRSEENIQTAVYFTTMVAGFFNCSLNPFIYALKYDVVKSYFGGLLSCRRNAVEHSPSDSNVVSSKTVSVQVAMNSSSCQHGSNIDQRDTDALQSVRQYHA
jgi:7 transmembrane receptor (rhodopsin family)